MKRQPILSLTYPYEDKKSRQPFLQIKPMNPTTLLTAEMLPLPQQRSRLVLEGSGCLLGRTCSWNTGRARITLGTVRTHTVRRQPATPTPRKPRRHTPVLDTCHPELKRPWPQGLPPPPPQLGRAEGRWPGPWCLCVQHYARHTVGTQVSVRHWSCVFGEMVRRTQIALYLEKNGRFWSIKERPWGMRVDFHWLLRELLHSGNGFSVISNT